MEATFCGMTAFNYHRIPPQVLAIYPPLPDTVDDPNHLKMANSPMGQLLGRPLHRLVNCKNQRHRANLYATHVIKNDLPFGSVQDTLHGFRVTSPEATLLTMAGEMSRVHLLMALYEMLGGFSVFKPDALVEQHLVELFGHRRAQSFGGWRRVIDTSGVATSLWMRPPLLDLCELRRFSDEASGFHGVKNLRWCAANATGVCASPLEAQASILLSLSRASGGEGIALENNRRIQLSPAARSIYPHDCCYADIFIEGNGDCAGVIVECQGKAVHAGDAAWSSDSDRATALACMGYEVVLLTNAQLRDARSFDAVADVIARKSGLKRPPKTMRQLEAQSKLRDELFIPWETLGN